MDTSVAKQMIGVIRAEQQRRARRADQLADENPELASDQWQFTDKPFVNELCLILLVAVWHQVEREVIWLAASITGDGKQITREQYLKNAKDAQKLWGKAREKIIEKLDLDEFPEWESSMQTLRLLANCYKHDSSQVPRKELLEHLQLDVTARYMPLPESRDFRKGLAAYTTAKASPGDIDIAVEVPLSHSREMAGLTPDHPIVKLLLGPLMKPAYRCDAYPVYALPKGDPHYASVTVRAIEYWTKWFGRSRTGTPKGRLWATTGGLK